MANYNLGWELEVAEQALVAAGEELEQLSASPTGQAEPEVTNSAEGEAHIAMLRAQIEAAAERRTEAVEAEVRALQAALHAPRLWT